VAAIDYNGIEVIDAATRKGISFRAEYCNQAVRFRGGAVDPDGKLFYTAAQRSVRDSMVFHVRR